MDRINFTGSFLIKQPNTQLYEKFCERVLPRSHRTIVKDVYKKDNVLVTVRKTYDKEIAEYLLARPFNFVYYPNAGTKKCFDSQFPKKAEEILNGQKRVLKNRSEIEAYIKRLTYSEKPITYKWRHNDHIDQTLTALKLKPEDCIVTTKDNVTTIYKKEDSRILAKVSPNNDIGDNFALLYPRFSQDPIKYAKINYKGEITEITSDISKLKEFKKSFITAVK